MPPELRFLGLNSCDQYGAPLEAGGRLSGLCRTCTNPESQAPATEADPTTTRRNEP